MGTLIPSPLSSQTKSSGTGRPWNAATVQAALSAFAEDFAPISDMRASAGYRLGAAQAMLERYFAEEMGEPVSVLEVQP